MSPPEPPEVIAARRDAEAILSEAQTAVERIVAQKNAEAERIMASADLEAERAIDDAQTQANRLLGQAQVELGRAREEATQLLAQAQARLDEAGEIISTAVDARQFLAQAKETAAELLASAETEAAASFVQARDEGREEGRRAGRDEGSRLAREELRHELELAHSLAAQIKIDREQLITEAEPAIIRLAMEAARKVVAREVEADPDILRGVLTRAMLKAAGEDRIRLRLHPDAIARLGDYLTNMTARFAARGVDVVPDRTVDVAGVIVDTRSGSVDARLSTQLEKIETALLSLTGEAA